MLVKPVHLHDIVFRAQIVLDHYDEMEKLAEYKAFKEWSSSFYIKYKVLGMLSTRASWKTLLKYS